MPSPQSNTSIIIAKIVGDAPGYFGVTGKMILRNVETSEEMEASLRFSEYCYFNNVKNGKYIITSLLFPDMHGWFIKNIRQSDSIFNPIIIDTNGKHFLGTIKVKFNDGLFGKDNKVQLVDSLDKKTINGFKDIKLISNIFKVKTFDLQ